MKHLKPSILLFFFVYFVSSEAAKILCVFQFTSKSHQIVFQTIWKALSEKGHQVTVVTPNPLKDATLTNLTELDVSHIYGLVSKKEHIQETMSKDTSLITMMKSFFKISKKLQEGILQDLNFRKIYEKENFDLIMVELLHPGMYSLAGKFKAPIIGVASLGCTEMTHNSLGNFVHPTLFPDMNLHEHIKPNLYQKIYSFLSSLYLNWYYNYVVIPEADAISRKYLGEVPYLGQLSQEVSLLFLNTNPIIHNIRPTIPQVIQLGSIHLKKPLPLPLQLQNFLDLAPQGAIYISFGTNIKNSNLPTNFLKNLIEALSELPYKVLWKWDGSLKLPQNIMAKPWFPQQDILAHPNIKAFITQGGLQSIEEAIDREVPMLGIPFIGDQVMNIKKLVFTGVALQVDSSVATKESLVQSIIQVAEDSKFKKKIKEVKTLINDQPMTGLERALWWTEYVIRHNGTKHLQSPTLETPWYQLLLLDVLLVFVLSVFVLYKILCVLIQKLGLTKKTKKKGS